jgi:hypothetical protein
LRINSSKAYEEAKIAFSETNKGNKYGLGKTKVISEKQKIEHSLFMKGRFVGDKNAFFGKTHSKEVKEKLKKARLGKSNAKRKVVMKDGIVIAIFDTIQQTADFIGCTPFNIKHALYGNQNTAKGYTIKYE